MGLLSRISTVFKSKANRLLDHAEDPRDTMELSYQKQQEQLQQVRMGIVEMATAKKRVENQAIQLQKRVDQYDADARDAVHAGRDDLAAQALQHKQQLMLQLVPLQTHVEELAQEEQKLLTLQQQMQAKIEAFRTQKEVIKAQYSAAQAQVKIGEQLNGLGSHMDDMAGALQRAQDKTEAMKARASAITDLSTHPAFDVASLPGTGDTIRDQLNQLSASEAVSSELLALKQSLQSENP